MHVSGVPHTQEDELDSRDVLYYGLALGSQSESREVQARSKAFPPFRHKRTAARAAPNLNRKT